MPGTTTAPIPFIAHFDGFSLWSLAGVGATLTLAGAATLLTMLGSRIRRGRAGVPGRVVIAAAAMLLTACWAFVVLVIAQEGADSNDDDLANILAIGVGTHLLFGFAAWRARTGRGLKPLAAFVGASGGASVWLWTLCLFRLDSHLAWSGPAAILGTLTTVAALWAVTQNRQAPPTIATTSHPAPATNQAAR